MLPLTLAAGWAEVIGVSIALVIFIGNLLAKGINKTNEQQDKASSSGESRAERLEKLAAKRRAELQNLASQHQHPSTSAPPTNITPQQATERQQAKTLYERRAEALRQMQQQSGRQAPPSSPQSAHRTQSSPTRAKQHVTPKDSVSSQEHPQTIAASNRKREQELSSVRRREEQLLHEREAALKKREELLRRKAQQLGAGVKQVSHVKHGDILDVHRHVDDLQIIPEDKPRGASTLLGEVKRNRNALRKAIILKEILDPPIALRQADELS